MNILFDDSGTFKTATILTDNETSLQVELSSGKRCKIKANNVLLRFTSPSSNQLLKQAEETAKERGCKYSFLDTFSFQAPEFYKKYGYKEVFALENYPVTGKRYYYTKTL